MRTVSVPFVCLALAASAAASARDSTFDREVAAEPKGVVEITNVAGSIQVSGWDRNTVSIHGELGESVERVDVTSQPGRTTIKVVLPEHSSRHGDADLKIQVPQGSELDISAVSADVTTGKVLGAQRLQSVSGDVHADVAADADVKTVSGDITVKGHGQPGSLHFTSVSGDLRVERLGGDVELSTVSGDVKGTLDATHGLRARTTSGDLRLGGRMGRAVSVDAESVSGELTLNASADGGYAYELRSFSGDINNCFGAQAERTSQYAPGRVLRGSRGEGAGKVYMKSMSGDLTLCDK
jgi:DUF4097 and DUF4098 domain-containing protein YvlB